MPISTNFNYFMRRMRNRPNSDGVRNLERDILKYIDEAPFPLNPPLMRLGYEILTNMNNRMTSSKLKSVADTLHYESNGIIQRNHINKAIKTLRNREVNKIIRGRRAARAA